jgi:hypothetical protein
MYTARVIIEVVAGMIPGRPEPEYTKWFWITSEEWNSDGADQARLLYDCNNRATGYASMLMMSPGRFNWVRLDWIYL